MINAIAHYLIPRYSNNYKAKLLQIQSIIVIILFTLTTQQAIKFATFTDTVKILGYKANIPVSEVIRLTNEKRAQAGLSKLSESSLLDEAAAQKGADMLAKGYWAHVSPDGTEPWYFFKKVGYKYRYAGENLARDFSSAQSAVDAWMASTSHKDNMLSSKYQEIGVAVVEGKLNGVETTIVVQHFGTIQGASTAVTPVSAKEKEVTTQDIKPIVVEAKNEVGQEPAAQELKSGGPALTEANKLQLESKISPFDITRIISVSIAGLFIILLIIDTFVVHKKAITRQGGRTLAHISFMSMILIIALILKAGKIL